MRLFGVLPPKRVVMQRPHSPFPPPPSFPPCARDRFPGGESPSGRTDAQHCDRAVQGVRGYGEGHQHSEGHGGGGGKTAIPFVSFFVVVVVVVVAHVFATCADGSVMVIVLLVGCAGVSLFYHSR